jgi:DNA invertase Pin-like site-specific DNA recombinase
MAFAMATEIERELISQRTKKALRMKKATGVRLRTRAKISLQRHIA